MHADTSCTAAKTCLPWQLTKQIYFLITGASIFVTLMQRYVPLRPPTPGMLGLQSSRQLPPEPHGQRSAGTTVITLTDYVGTRTHGKLLLQQPQPLPWRALHHIAAKYSGQGNQAPAPAYLVSAFLDTRPMKVNLRPRLAVILAVEQHQETTGWSCLVLNPDAGGKKQHLARMTVGHVYPNNEAFLHYQTTIGYCDLPTELDSMVDTISSNGSGSGNGGGGSGSSSSNSWVKAAQPTLTVIATEQSGRQASVEPAMIDTIAWVPVQTIPQLSAAELANYSAGKGPVAICAPVVHTDAYASTLAEWVEFQKLMGVSSITMYSFNPGPFLKPLMDYYQSQGLLQVYEWIIPASILHNQQQECKLPFFHESANRAKFGSANCTYHQDNYQIPHWGQTLAIQDCVYRAMVSKQRWVAVLDLDEYFLPKESSVTNWPSLISHVSGRYHAEYMFQGFRLCSGCVLDHAQSSSKTQQLPATAAEAPAAGTPGACMHPSVGLHHMLWSAAVDTHATDHIKSIIAPLAVDVAGVHSTRAFSPYSLSSGSMQVPEKLAIKLHDRVHDIHTGNSTFAARMLPLLKQHLSAVLSAPAVEQLPLFPAAGTCNLCGSTTRGSGSLGADFTLCNVYGHQLYSAVRNTTKAMQQAGVFQVWSRLDSAAANLYGGCIFDQWAPPKPV